MAGTAITAKGIITTTVGANMALNGISYAIKDAKNLGSDKDEQSNDTDPIRNKNLNKVDDKYLKRKGIDAHELKKEILRKKSPIAEYDIYVDKNTGELFILKKGGKGVEIATGEFIK